MDTNTYNIEYENLPEPFSNEETIEKFMQMHHGNGEARKELIVHNLRLVKKIALNFVKKGNEFDEVFQAGCLGLINGIDQFDISKKYTFSTYATKCIKNEILDFINYHYKYNKNVSIYQPKYDSKVGKEILIEDSISDEKQNFIDSKIEQMIIQSLIDELDERSIKVLKLYYEEGYTQQEIAPMFDTSRQNIALILKSSENKIKQKLKRIHY